MKRLPTVAYVGAWLINSQATNHEPYQKCRPAKNFIFKQTRRVSGAKTLQQKPSQFHQKADPVLGSKKRAPFWGPFSMLLFLFQYGTQKRGPFFHLKIEVSFCCFSVVAIALLRLRGWSIFICISNSGRPTVLTVGSWFVLWLLNNRPALHTVAYVGAWLINSQQQTMSHIRNAGLRRISYSNKPGACQAQRRCSKSPHNFTKRRALFWGPKNGPRFGVRFLCCYSFSNMEPKKGVHFSTSKLGFLFVVFLLLLLHFCA